MHDHQLIDQRSLAFATAIAGKVRQDPSLIDLARDNLRRWRETCSPRSISTFDEWTEILNGSVEELIEMLTAENERATRLRQSNPFAGALSNAERNAILLEFEARDKAAT